MNLIQNEMILWIIYQAVKKYCYISAGKIKKVLVHFLVF